MIPLCQFSYCETACEIFICASVEWVTVVRLNKMRRGAWKEKLETHSWSVTQEPFFSVGACAGCAMTQATVTHRCSVTLDG